MIIHGTREWSDYRVETALTVHLAEHAGVGVRVQGLRRFYAVLLVRSNILRLVRARDGETTVLAETAFEWSFERPHHFIIETVGQEIAVSVDGVRLAARDDSEAAIADGGVALIVEGGSASSDEIKVGGTHMKKPPALGGATIRGGVGFPVARSIGRQENEARGPTSRPAAEGAKATPSKSETLSLARPRPHIGAFAGPRARPDFHHLARRRIEEALAREAPVRSRRSVEGRRL